MGKISFYRVFTVLTSLVIGSAAVATPYITYDYVGLQYTNQKLDDFDCTQDGLRGYGSLEIDSNWFALASITDVSGDGCGSTTVAAGAGYHAEYNKQFDMYGSLRFESTSPDKGDSDSGLIIAAGLRGIIAKNLEGRLELAHHTIYDGETGINGGVAYWFTPVFSATLDLDLNSNGETISAGVRMLF